MGVAAAEARALRGLGADQHSRWPSRPSEEGCGRSRQGDLGSLGCSRRSSRTTPSATSSDGAEKIAVAWRGSRAGRAHACAVLQHLRAQDGRDDRFGRYGQLIAPRSPEQLPLNREGRAAGGRLSRQSTVQSPVGSCSLPPEGLSATRISTTLSSWAKATPRFSQ